MRSKGDIGAKAASGTWPRCPICGKPRDAAYLPFCSKRCADVDLGRWLKGNYAIPGKPEENEDGEEGMEEARRAQDEDERGGR